MSPSRLSAAVDAWTVQAMVASSHLVNLYRSLGDDQQAIRALLSRGPCEERAHRLSLGVQIAALLKTFRADHPEEVVAETQAWQMLVEAQAGLYALYGLVEQDPTKGRGLRGPMTQTRKAFHGCLKGYLVALPKEMAAPGIQMAFVSAAEQCAAAFSLDVDGTSEEEKSSLRQEIQVVILSTLEWEFKSVVE